MGLTSILTLLLLAQGPAAPIPTRIVESRESPVSLVGLPCEANSKKVRAVEPKRVNAPLLESATFACEKDCAVGVRVKEGQSVASFTIATAMVHDRGRVTSAVTPALTTPLLQSCNGETFAVVSMPRIAWPATAGIVFVAEVTYQNGTSWHVDGDAVQDEAFKQWRVQPKRGQ